MFLFVDELVQLLLHPLIREKWPGFYGLTCQGMLHRLYKLILYAGTC